MGIFLRQYPFSFLYPSRNLAALRKTPVVMCSMIQSSVVNALDFFHRKESSQHYQRNKSTIEGERLAAKHRHLGKKDSFIKDHSLLLLFFPMNVGTFPRAMSSGDCIRTPVFHIVCIESKSGKTEWQKARDLPLPSEILWKAYWWISQKTFYGSLPRG